MAVVPDHSQLRLPAPGNNAQAVSKTGEAARERTVHVRVCTCNMCPGRARSGKADRKLRALQAWLLARGRWSHLRVAGWCPWLEEVGDEVDRGVDRLARALLPRLVHGDVCAWVLCVRSGVWGGAVVCCSRVAAGRRGWDSGGDRTSS